MRLQTHVSYGGLFFGIATIAIVAVALSVSRAPVHALDASCSPAGFTLAQTSGPAQLTPADEAASARAMAWIESMTHTRTVLTTTSTITPSQNYSASHTGPIAGTFDLRDETYPIVNNASLTVTSPIPVTDEYRGVISGTIKAAPESGRWIIQAYKRTSSGATQVPRQTLVDSETGNFTIDLTTVDPSLEGAWELDILDRDAGYAPTGNPWPAPSFYDGLEVQQLLITDNIYDWATVPARADGTFSFPNSNPGAKMFRLVDSESNDILAEQVQLSGLVRSYLYEAGESGHGTGMEDRNFVYDQALAIFAAMSRNDEDLAKLLVDGLLKLQTQTGEHVGGFVFAAPQLNPSFTDPMYRTGAHAIATDALLAYIEKYPADSDRAAYMTQASEALDFIDRTRSETPASQGLYLGGYGNYSGNPQVFHPEFVIEWASAEHNIDIWHTFERASRIYPSQATEYKDKASALGGAIYSKLYNQTDKRMNQGVNAAGTPDTADPLDVNSWGAIQLAGMGKQTEAELALSRVSLFEYTHQGIEGYSPFYDSPGYPGAVPTVWYEGSFGVVLAYYKLGDYESYRTTLNSLAAGQEADGSFRYATDADPQYEIGVSKSIAGAAWYVLATDGRDLLWNTCVYTEPTDPTDPIDPETPPVVNPETPETPKAPDTPKKPLAPLRNSNTSPTTTSEEVAQEDPKTETPTPSINPGDTSKPARSDDEDCCTEKESVNVPLIAGVAAGVAVTGAVVFAIARRRRGDI